MHNRSELEIFAFENKPIVFSICTQNVFKLYVPFLSVSVYLIDFFNYFVNALYAYVI